MLNKLFIGTTCKIVHSFLTANLQYRRHFYTNKILINKVRKKKEKIKDYYLITLGYIKFGKANSKAKNFKERQ